MSVLGDAIGAVTSVALNATSGLHVELTFIAAFGLLWLAGRVVSERLRGQPPLKEHARNGARRAAKAVPSEPRPTGGGRPRPQAGGPAHEREPLASASNADPAQLRDVEWLAPQVAQLCRTQVQRALELYRAAMRAGLDLKQAPSEACGQLFMALVTSAIRVGDAEEALGLLQELRRKGPGVGVSLACSATKLCTSKQLFEECLVIYDFVAEDPDVKIDDSSVWSCLLFCSVEAKAYSRCQFFFNQIKACGVPSTKDYGNMVRFASMRGASQLALGLIQEMRKAGVEIDSVVYNTALATCVGAEEVDQARHLLEDMDRAGAVSDVITYNTLAKGYARAGRMDQCFELYEAMRARGIEPSQVTYGILLDGCINENKLDRAVEIFQSMTREGCVMNTVLYTTLIKGFVRAGQVDQAMQVYKQMRTERGVPPDIITFSILIKANCDASGLDVSLQLLKAMLEQELRPDEVIFNNLLGGCAKEANAVLAKRLYEDMLAGGIKPSNATYSILIRLYAQCNLLDEAVDMLRHEPQAQGVEPEQRLFSQLAQCCLRGRQGRRAIEVYKLMLDHSPATMALNGSLLGTCVKLNMLETAAELLACAAEHGGRVDPRDADQVLKAALRKRKQQTADACSGAMLKLGLTPAPARE